MHQERINLSHVQSKDPPEKKIIGPGEAVAVLGKGGRKLGSADQDAAPARDSQPAAIEDLLAKLRSLERAQRWSDLETQSRAAPTSDGELFLRRSRAALAQGRAADALGLLESATQTASALMSPDELQREVFFTKGKCHSAHYDQNPTAAAAKSAMDTWFLLKYQFRANPTHEYFITADQEIRRISAHAGGAASE